MVAARIRALFVTCTSSSELTSIMTTLPSTTARASASASSPSSSSVRPSIMASMLFSTSSATRTSNDTSSRSIDTPRVRPSKTCRAASRPISESRSNVPVPTIRPSSSRAISWIVPTTWAPSWAPRSEGTYRSGIGVSHWRASASISRPSPVMVCSMPIGPDQPWGREAPTPSSLLVTGSMPASGDFSSSSVPAAVSVVVPISPSFPTPTITHRQF